MSATAAQESAVNKGVRERYWVYLTQAEFERLEELAKIQQDVLAQTLRNQSPFSIVPRDISEWYHTDAGKAKFEELRLSDTYSTTIYELAFEAWKAEQLTPGASSSNLRNKFPIAHCMGLVIGRVLAVYKTALKETLEHEFEATKTKAQ